MALLVGTLFAQSADFKISVKVFMFLRQMIFFLQFSFESIFVSIFHFVVPTVLMVEYNVIDAI